jgi:hypothetical protein
MYKPVNKIVQQGYYHSLIDTIKEAQVQCERVFSFSATRSLKREISKFKLNSFNRYQNYLL